VLNLTLTRDDCAALDQTDPLASARDEFYLPDDLVYLDGNSLGPVPKATPGRVAQAVEQEWGEGLIRSWMAAGWMEMPQRIGDKLARLIGAGPGEVVCTDSTSINVFKVIAAAVKLNSGRRVILSERDNFPTDLYMAQGLIELMGGSHELRLVHIDELVDAIDEDTAVVMLTHCNYKTGRMYDMADITARAHAQGALMMWDLAHSIGAVPVDLTAAGVDFAVGCGYKYLNGGPGAPAFVWVAPRHQPRFSQPLSGWIGHANPFAFDPYYQPAEGVGRYMVGSPPILSMTAMECGVDSVLAHAMTLIRAKSLALTDLFIQLVETRCGSYGLELVTPRAHNERGSQVSWRHPEGYAVMQALIARGVIGDFRAPDILRFGFTPLYTRYVDVWDAVEHLAQVLHSREWDQAHFKQQAMVT
jgi:kynureninase